MNTLLIHNAKVKVKGFPEAYRQVISHEVFGTVDQVTVVYVRRPSGEIVGVFLKRLSEAS